MGGFTQFICPICGKFNSVRKYDPTDFIIDVLAVETKGEGRGYGTSVVSRESIFTLGMNDLAELIGDRISCIYSLFYDVEEEDAEEKDEHEEHQDRLLQAINYEVQDYYPRGFDNIFEAALALLKVHRRHKVDEEDEEDDEEDEYEAQDIEDGEMYDPAADSRREEDYSKMSELDRQLAIADRDLAREDTPL